MIDADKQCEAVLTQVMATKSALNQVGMHVIGHAMKTCLIDSSVTDRDELVSAAFDVFLRYRDMRDRSSNTRQPAGMSQAELVDTLRMIDEQLQTVERIVGASGDCDSALEGLSKAAASLDAVGIAVLGRAMHRCLIAEQPAGRDEVVEQAVEVFLRYSSCAR
jgi:DNA-binding FrmR family transcriptional regulator